MTGITEIFFDGIDQHIVADSLCGADPQLQPFSVGNAKLQFLELVALGDRIAFQQQAVFCFVQRVPVVEKQLRLQGLLQRLDLFCNRRLRKMQPLRRQTVVHGPAEHQEGLQFLFHSFLHNKLESLYSI